MTEFSLIFSADMMVPPNLTAVLNENLEGANFKLIFLHNLANLSICTSRSSSPEEAEIVHVLQHLEVLIELGPPVRDPVEEVLG